MNDASALARRCGIDVLRLRPLWPTLIGWLPRLGPVMVRSMGAHVEIRQNGTFSSAAFLAPHHAFLGGTFGIQCRVGRWASAFVRTRGDGARGLRVHDTSGACVWAVDLMERSDALSFDELVWSVYDPNQSQRQTLAPRPAPVARADAEIDAEALRDALGVTRSPYECDTVLRRMEIPRERAWRLLGGQQAWRTGIDDILHALSRARIEGIEIGCVVENGGLVHTFLDRPTRVDLGSVVRLSYPDRTRVTIDFGAVARAWIVRMPGAFGPVSSIELFTASGEHVVTLLGKRCLETGECAAWRRLIGTLPRVD